MSSCGGGGGGGAVIIIREDDWLTPLPVLSLRRGDELSLHCHRHHLRRQTAAGDGGAGGVRYRQEGGWLSYDTYGNVLKAAAYFLSSPDYEEVVDDGGGGVGAEVTFIRVTVTLLYYYYPFCNGIETLSAR